MFESFGRQKQNKSTHHPFQPHEFRDNLQTFAPLKGAEAQMWSPRDCDCGLRRQTIVPQKASTRGNTTSILSYTGS